MLNTLVALDSQVELSIIKLKYGKTLLEIVLKFLQMNLWLITGTYKNKMFLFRILLKIGQKEMRIVSYSNFKIVFKIRKARYRSVITADTCVSASHSTIRLIHSYDERWLGDKQIKRRQRRDASYANAHHRSRVERHRRNARELRALQPPWCISVRGAHFDFIFDVNTAPSKLLVSMKPVNLGSDHVGSRVTHASRPRVRVRAHN